MKISLVMVVDADQEPIQKLERFFRDAEIRMYAANAANCEEEIESTLAVTLPSGERYVIDGIYKREPVAEILRLSRTMSAQDKSLIIKTLTSQD